MLSNKKKLRLIAKYLVSAKICSNAGKGIRDRFIVCRSEKKYIRWAYRGKQHQIEMALRLIDSMPFQTMFQYYLKEEMDQNGKPSVVILFHIQLDNIKTQMAFHIPFRRASGFIKSKIGKGTPIKWERGKDDSPILLSNYFDM